MSTFVRTPEQLAALEEIKTAVYHRAQRVEDHDFQKFAALMDAYIDLRRAEAEGKSPPAHKARYIGEQVARIFGDLFSDREARALFVEAAGLEPPPYRGVGGLSGPEALRLSIAYERMQRKHAEVRAQIAELADSYEDCAEDLEDEIAQATAADDEDKLARARAAQRAHRGCARRLRELLEGRQRDESAEEP